MRPAELPSVCIVGRPNVGKSALFNRIIGERKAVVHTTSGTTRDRIETLYERDEMAFWLIDTGGFLKESPDVISSLVKRQIEEAITQADILLFVCDVKSGVTPQDEELVPILRETNKKVFLIINKADNKSLDDDIYDFYRFGLGEPYPVSAIHDRGINRLIDDIFKEPNLKIGQKGQRAAYKIAIVGRPNVGKSLFLNTLLKEERVIVDKNPGTTRDSIDTYFRKDNNLYLLIDTAGIRHKRKVKEAVDVYSMSRSKEAIERSDVSFLLIDGYEGLRNDDIRIFSSIVEAGRCCVVVINKWDLVKGIPMADYYKAILRRAPGMASYPAVFASAKTGRNLLSCIDMVKYVAANSSQGIETKKLNKFLSKLKGSIAQKIRKGPKIYYMVQISKKPPSFLIFINTFHDMTKDITSFIERMLRKEYNFYGTPVKIRYRMRG